MSEYSIEFSPKCLEKMGEIESIPHIDEALQAVYSALEKDPYAFPIAPPSTIRVATTDFYLRDDFSVPSLIIYFTIVEDDKIVRIFDILKLKGFGELEDT